MPKLKRAPLRAATIVLALCIPLSGGTTAQAANAGVSKGDTGEATPRIQWGKKTYCISDEKGRRYHAQVQSTTGGVERIVLAPTQDATRASYERIDGCEDLRGMSTVSELRKGKLPIVSGIASAPPGFHRDNRGRVMQTSFDMLRRYHFGVHYAPAFGSSNAARNTARVRLDTGLIASFTDRGWQTNGRHDIEALRADLSIADLEIRGHAFSWEYTRVTTEPALRFTTFFGAPARHDVNMDLGGGLRILGVHSRVHRTPNLLELEYGSGFLNWVLIRNGDLSSRLLARAGVSAGQLADSDTLGRTSHWVAPGGALDARMVVDPNGFHTLNIVASASAPIDVKTGGTALRVQGAMAYELIMLAINDQPLSLRLEGGASYRTDLPERAPRMDAQASAGLRFSFWAPGRKYEAFEFRKNLDEDDGRSRTP